METRTITSYTKKSSKKGPYYEVELDNGIVGLCFYQGVPNIVNTPVKVTLRPNGDTTFINVDEKSLGNEVKKETVVTQTKEKSTSVETMCLSYLKDITISMISKDMFKNKEEVSGFLGNEFKDMYHFFVELVKNQN